MFFEYSSNLNDSIELELDLKSLTVKNYIADVVSINFHEISNVKELVKIKEEWKKLFHKSADATPFQSWEWNYAMINKFTRSEKLKIIVGYNNRNEIVGLAPLKLKCYRLTGIKILEFIGNGPSDYLDFLVQEKYRYTFIRSLFDLIKNSKDWTILNFINMKEETKNLLAFSLPVEVSEQDVCPYVFLPGSMDEYENEVHKRELKNIKRQLRKLVPQNRLEYIVKDSPDTLSEDVEKFIELHQKRHNSKGERGRFCSEDRKESFYEISKFLNEAGILKIEMLKIDSQIAAINYILLWNDRKYNYLSGMNPVFANFKPGKILIYYMIEDAINKGCKVFDFLQGAEEYKYFWTNKEIQLYSAVYSRSRICLLLWTNVLTLKNRLKCSAFLKRAYQMFCKLLNKDIASD
ncbi:MAG: GNAT family N-acetyltransferase [Ignavibacteriaceae bacterium]